MRAAKVRLKKAAVILRLNISAVSPNMKNPRTKQIPIKLAVAIIETFDLDVRQKINSGTKKTDKIKSFLMLAFFSLAAYAVGALVFYAGAAKGLALLKSSPDNLAWGSLGQLLTGNGVSYDGNSSVRKSLEFRA